MSASPLRSYCDFRPGRNLAHGTRVTARNQARPVPPRHGFAQQVPITSVAVARRHNGCSRKAKHGNWLGDVEAGELASVFTLFFKTGILM
jgi:hypothetical protein